ncbi:hypothetical protein A3C89_03225 [Candidatus Kaiserbacteria bacterium RIFCSPHIGHO2_02_FULL_50_50]|uniref:SCP domain-containing protein n=1 Tax=Candidatus Kaiserbacteria bacterium RIFCSPHIGHO2_02_FULL_50_50 TaxID=1798492 RepID=A0A1F6DF31_9BACT|nr:MAG: hypothetical protein A3C89_03225 [Candidatus Kaiserbacteria bacterium RIFCSPHIGHO2_02_FULL_50_50]OGG88102.1 MAG: hypothetical protein A3G62_02410 [Candidatus Kaiserbacteria bacterium RIFCSPLOWO2_12_FULL_50_10]
MNTVFKKIGYACIMLAVLIAGSASIFAIVQKASPAAVVASSLVQGTNTARVSENLKLLTRSAVLDKAATLKANDMLQHQYFAHRSPSGVTPWHWFEEAHYKYLRAGENLAVHFTASTELVDAWLASPSHRANIMNGAYTEIGIGMATGTFEGVQTTFVVQLFGTPVPASKQGAAVGLLDTNEYRVVSESIDVAPDTLATIERTVDTRKHPYAPIAVTVFLIGALSLAIHVCIRCLTRSCTRTSLIMVAVILALSIALFVMVRIMLTGVL